MLAPGPADAYGDVHTTTIVLAAAAAVLVATALLQGVLLGRRRPLVFFGWIVVVPLGSVLKLLLSSGECPLPWR